MATQTAVTSPAVSIVLPVYNRASTVGRAIRSVLDQTYRNFELVVVDDQSTDQTPDVVADFTSDPRVRLVRSDQNLGAAGARNFGVERSTAPWIAFQDSDDRWFPDKLESQVNRSKQPDQPDIVYCGSIYYSPEQCYYIPRTLRWTTPADHPRRQLLFGNMLTPQALLIKRAVFDDSGGFDDRLTINEDWDLALRLARAHTMAYVPEPLLLIYRTPGSVSTDARADAEFRERFLREFASELASHPDALAHQHYVTGREYLSLGELDLARRHLRSAVCHDLNIRTVARWIESELAVLVSRAPIIAGPRRRWRSQNPSPPGST